MYTQEKTGQQWMTILQEMVFQIYFLTVLADKPEVALVGADLQEMQADLRSAMVTAEQLRTLGSDRHLQGAP